VVVSVRALFRKWGKIGSRYKSWQRNGVRGKNIRCTLRRFKKNKTKKPREFILIIYQTLLRLRGEKREGLPGEEEESDERVARRERRLPSLS